MMMIIIIIMGHECKRGLFGRGESAIGGGEEDGVLKG
jgi:hypothetical protein